MDSDPGREIAARETMIPKLIALLIVGPGLAFGASPHHELELALKLEPLIAAKAKGNQRQSAGRGQKGLQNSADLNPVDTREELAKVAGVSHDTISRAKTILEKGDKDTIAKQQFKPTLTAEELFDWLASRD